MAAVPHGQRMLRKEKGQDLSKSSAAIMRQQTLLRQTDFAQELNAPVHAPTSSECIAPSQDSSLMQWTLRFHSSSLEHEWFIQFHVSNRRRNRVGCAIVALAIALFAFAEVVSDTLANDLVVSNYGTQLLCARISGFAAVLWGTKVLQNNEAFPNRYSVVLRLLALVGFSSIALLDVVGVLGACPATAFQFTLLIPWVLLRMRCFEAMCINMSCLVVWVGTVVVFFSRGDGSVRAILLVRDAAASIGLVALLYIHSCATEAANRLAWNKERCISRKMSELQEMILRPSEPIDDNADHLVDIDAPVVKILHRLEGLRELALLHLGNEAAACVVAIMDELSNNRSLWDAPINDQIRELTQGGEEVDAEIESWLLGTFCGKTNADSSLAAPHISPNSDSDSSDEELGMKIGGPIGVEAGHQPPCSPAAMAAASHPGAESHEVARSASFAPSQPRQIASRRVQTDRPDRLSKLRKRSLLKRSSSKHFRLQPSGHSSSANPGISRSSTSIIHAAECGAGVAHQPQVVVSKGVIDEIEVMLKQSSDWDWDVFKFIELAESRALASFTGFWLDDMFGVGKSLRLDYRVLWLYFSEVQSGYYRQNPYHNDTHALDVTHAMTYMLHQGKLKTILDPVDIFAAAFAAAVHDVGHRGVNNQFLVLTKDELAITYSDSAVLERYHIASAYRIAGREGLNIFEHFSRERYAGFRSTTIDLVLATDISTHFTLLGMFNAQVSPSTVMNSSEPLPIAVRRLILQIGLHAADTGNPARLPKYAKQWTDRIMKEFFNQGDMEKSRNLPVSPFMDRESTIVAKCQMGFIDFIVEPTWSCIVHVLDPVCSKLLDNIATNRAYWEAEQEKCVSPTRDASPRPKGFRRASISIVDTSKTKKKGSGARAS